MSSTKPIKRHENLKPLSREHHHGLLLCWKIRTGISKGVETGRIKDYALWFYQNHLKSHFKMEEEQIFPLLGNEHELVKKALAEHRRLHRLFKLKEDTEKKLSLIEEDLDNHIRFEERILFNKIQEVAKEEELENIHAIHNDHEFKDDWEDPFWE